jgi:hypothetical protein
VDVPDWFGVVCDVQDLLCFSEEVTPAGRWREGAGVPVDDPEAGPVPQEGVDAVVHSSRLSGCIGETAETIDDRDSPDRRGRFTGWLEGFVRAVHGHARERNEPSTTNEAARRALTKATEFTFPSPTPEQAQRSQTGNPQGRGRRRTRAGRESVMPQYAQPSAFRRLIRLFVCSVSSVRTGDVNFGGSACCWRDVGQWDR